MAWYSCSCIYNKIVLDWPEKAKTVSLLLANSLFLPLCCLGRKNPHEKTSWLLAWLLFSADRCAPRPHQMFLFNSLPLSLFLLKPKAHNNSQFHPPLHFYWYEWIRFLYFLFIYSSSLASLQIVSLPSSLLVCQFVTLPYLLSFYVWW